MKYILILGLTFTLMGTIACQKIDETTYLVGQLTDLVMKESGFAQIQSLESARNLQGGGRIASSQTGNLLKQSSIGYNAGKYLKSQSGTLYLATSVNIDPLGEILSLPLNKR